MSVTEENGTSSDEGGECRIRIHSQVTPGGVMSRRVSQTIETALEGRCFREISVAFVDDATIARLHRDYMGDPSPTDVITFDLRDDVAGGDIEGEIVVSVETARRQAIEFGRPLEEEILRYVIHGALHLAGMNDETEEESQAMRREENRILRACDLRASGSGEGGKQ